jgi:hypothetical protein
MLFTCLASSMLDIERPEPFLAKNTVLFGTSGPTHLKDFTGRRPGG